MSVPVINVQNYALDVLVELLVTKGYVVLDNWRSLVSHDLSISCSEAEYYQITSSKTHKVAFTDETITIPSADVGETHVDGSEDLSRAADTAISMVTKALGLNYTFLNLYLTDRTTSVSCNRLYNWTLLSLIYVPDGRVQLDVKDAADPVEIQGPGMILGIGKVLEIVTKGLLFSNIRAVRNASYISVSKHFNVNLHIQGDLMANVSGPLNTNRINYSRWLRSRLWRINYLRDPTIGEDQQKLQFNTATNSNIHTGKDHMFGYLQNNTDFLQLADAEMNYVDFDIPQQHYLACFLAHRTVGEMLVYELVSKGHNICKAAYHTVQDSLVRLEKLKTDCTMAYLGFLVRIFSNLDNILYIYFLNHTNLPNLNQQFLPSLRKLLGKNVGLSDILKIKYLFPESYNLFLTGILKNEGVEVLIGLEKTQLETPNFAKLIAERKKTFIAKVDEYIASNKNNLNKIDHLATSLIHSLPTVSVNSATLSSTKEHIGKKTTAIRKIIKKESSKVSKPHTDKSLSLLERIKLKQAQKKKALQENHNLSANGQSAARNDELLLVFDILYNLNHSNAFKSFTLRTLIDKIIDSFATKANLVGSAGAERALKTMGERLPPEIFQIVDFDNGKTIVKYNFFNRREEAIKLLTK